MVYFYNELVEEKIKLEISAEKNCVLNLDMKELESRLNEIESILIKYKFEKYLKQSKQRISMIYYEKLKAS